MNIKIISIYIYIYIDIHYVCLKNGLSISHWFSIFEKASWAFGVSGVFSLCAFAVAPMCHLVAAAAGVVQGGSKEVVSSCHPSGTLWDQRSGDELSRQVVIHLGHCGIKEVEMRCRVKLSLIWNRLGPTRREGVCHVVTCLEQSGGICNYGHVSFL